MLLHGIDSSGLPPWFSAMIARAGRFLMQVQPLYDARGVQPAYHLRYSWTGWPLVGASFPEPLPWRLPELEETWELDGLRVLEGTASRKMIQITFSVQPCVSPVFFCSRVKGRLQYALRKAGTPLRFSRKLAMRSVGENRTADVERYIHSQVTKERFADPRFAQALEELRFTNTTHNLTTPSETGGGRYWYNLHVVLVMEERCRLADLNHLRRLRDQTLRIAAKKEHIIACLTVLPDHLHVALRGNVEHSPEDIALSFQNNLAYALGQVRIWQATYYVGTFGEYDMAAIRRKCQSHQSLQAPDPHRLADG
jgi:REP element-mobilizing transposase RayT